MPEEQKNKLYVGNLPYEVDEDELKELFGKVGEVEEAIIITVGESDRSKGFGFVTMADKETAQKAIDEMSGKEVGGREIKVDIARPKEE